VYEVIDQKEKSLYYTKRNNSVIKAISNDIN